MRWVVGALLCVVMAAPARAEDTGDLEVARRHYDVGARYYSVGDYHHALEEFLTAQRLHPVPAFDFNLGHTYDKLDQPDNAILHYQRYLASNPPDAAEVQSRVNALQLRALATRRPAPDDAPARRKRRTLAIVLGVVGGVVVVSTAVALGVTLGGSSAGFSQSTLGPMRVTP